MLNSALLRFCAVVVMLTVFAAASDASRPNVVMIMTDNHGAWTLGCYGNQDIRTPNIDRLAREGTLFDNAFASNPVCSPTRATTLTGLIPSQHGVHCFLRLKPLQMGPNARNTLDEFTSLPEVLKAAGYRCGLVGKWHLGANISPQEGLDDYWITMPHGGTSTFYDAKIIESGKERTEPEYLTDFWTKHAVKFIEQQATGERDEPFFLFLSYNGPYSLSRLLLREGRNRHAEFYRGRELPSFPRESPHPWQLHNRDYQNNPVSIQRVATEVSGVDDGVGTVMDALKAYGLDDNTVVVFLADQGWVGGHGGFFGMGDHTQPATARDGMMKIPMIWRQPGEISAGQRSSKLVANYDVMPTLLEHLGLKAAWDDRTAEPVSPGRSFRSEFDSSTADADAPSALAAASGSDAATADAVYYEFETLRCIRTNEWKYVHRYPNGPHELYHLATDPEEFNNLYQPNVAITLRRDEPRSASSRVSSTVSSGSTVPDRTVTAPRLAAKGDGKDSGGASSTPAAPRHAERDGNIEIQRVLRKRLDSFYAEYALPKYDLYNGGGAQTILYDGIEEEAAQIDPVSPPPLTDGFAPQQFTLPDGFDAQLVAGPPLVTHPTMGCFDDTGRLFVCNNAGVNMSAEDLEKHLPNSINMLEDQDGDGVFDKSTVFADKMTFPMGGAWHDGALYVASPPNIWRLQDTTGDGVADRRDIIVDSFGYTGNAASIHGCFFSPDGRLYWCDGYHGHEFKDKDGNIVSKRKGSYIFSCWPDGSDVRIHCGGGMDNPVEVDFTEEGDIIGTVNILYTRPRVDCLVHWQYGGAYPHREAVLEELKVTGELLGPIHRFGHVAISGTTRYRSGTMDHRWSNNFFATQFNLGKVVRLELARSGSTYSVTQREFLSCSNRDFHPTDVIEDADGSLLVVDTGGWFYRGCPTSQISKPDVLGGIYRIRRTGMTTMSDPRGLRTDWQERSNQQLMRDLKDTRFAVQEKVIQECVRRGEGILDSLVNTIKSGDIVARKNAVWTATGIFQKTGSATARRGLLMALHDRSAQIRQAAWHGIGAAKVLSEESAERLAGTDRELWRMAAEGLMMKERSAAVRREAYATLAVLRLKGFYWAYTVRKTNPSADTDREERHALHYALLESGDTLSVPEDGKNRQQFLANLRDDAEAVVVMDQLTENGLPASVLKQCISDGSPEVVQAAAKISRRRLAQKTLGEADLTSIQDAAAARARQLISTGRMESPRELQVLLRTFGTSAEFASVVEDTLASSDTSTRTLTAVLQAIAGESTLPLHDGWKGPLRTLMASGDSFLRIAAIDAVGAIGATELFDDLLPVASDPSEAVPVRLAALRAVVRASGALARPGVFPLLMGLAREGSPAEQQTAAQLLGVSAPTPAQLIAIAPLLADAGPQPLTDLVKLFRRSSRADVAQAFLDNVETARSLASLPRLEVSEVVKRFPPELHGRANALLDRMQVAEQAKVRKLDALIGELKAGNAARGKDVFFSEKAKCATCHVVGAKGKRVGPDLTTIGASRTAKDLLESIIFPSSTIVRQYEPYTLVADDGRTYSGLVIKDTSESVTVQQSTGDPVTISRSEIDELVPATVSIMPKGLDESLSSRQIADLVAWLQTLK